MSSMPAMATPVRSAAVTIPARAAAAVLDPHHDAAVAPVDPPHAGQGGARLGEGGEVAGAADVDAVAGAELGDQLAAGALGHQPALVDDADPVAEALGLLHVVRGVEHRQALAAERLDALEDGVAALRVDAHGRLVEHQELGVVQQAGGDVGPALHAARVVADAVAGPVGQTDQVEHLGHPLAEDRAAEALQAAEELAGSPRPDRSS